ncbi:hypothetical protein FRX31_012240, partial [Thalictrum thalictroides]
MTTQSTTQSTLPSRAELLRSFNLQKVANLKESVKICFFGSHALHRSERPMGRDPRTFAVGRSTNRWSAQPVPTAQPDATPSFWQR